VARLEVTEPRARLLKHSPTRQLACAEGSSLQCETVDSLTQTEGRTSKLAQRPGEHGQSFSGICNANLTVGRNWCRCTTPQQRGIHYLMEHPKAERGKHSTSLANRETSKEWFPSDRQTSYAYSDQRAARGSSAARWIAELSQALSSPRSQARHAVGNIGRANPSP